MSAISAASSVVPVSVIPASSLAVMRAATSALSCDPFKRRHLAQPLLAGSRRIPGPARTGRHITHDTGLGPEHCACPNGQVISHAGLAAHNDTVLHRGATRDSDLAREQAVTADRHVVRDVHHIVDLGSLPDHGVADGPPVDGAIGADLDVVLDDHTSHLGNLVGPARPAHKAEAILANGGPGGEDDPVANQGMNDGAIGPDRAVPPNADLRPNGGPRSDHGPAATLGARSNHSAWVDGHSVFEAS